ncbi:hypothetical protein H106_06888 [Trichophyton rubrum CBS 735.88]|nr:hypothetical protein H106_06888 [Trichophyton rubrum CBS 735.88]
MLRHNPRVQNGLQVVSIPTFRYPGLFFRLRGKSGSEWAFGLIMVILDECQPIEIISPPYWARTTHWENDLQRIFSSRMGRYNPISARELKLYSELNNTTSIHVHVGNGVDPGSSFPFHTVRNLAMILLVYEPALDRLLDAKLYPPPILLGNRDHSQDVSHGPPCLSLAVSRLV